MSDAGAPRTIAVHLFGGPYVCTDGGWLTVPEGSKRLLAFVALRRVRVERHYVAGTLWPACGDGRAAGNLRSALWRLRGAGIDVLECDKWSLRLLDRVSVDVHELKAWADRVISGRLAAGTSTPPISTSTPWTCCRGGMTTGRSWSGNDCGRGCCTPSRL